MYLDTRLVCLRLRLRAAEFWNWLMQSKSGYAFSWSDCWFLKNEATWCGIPEDFKVPNTIQSQEYSKGSGIDGFRYENSVRWTSTGTAMAGTWTPTTSRIRTGGTTGQPGVLPKLLYSLAFMWREFCFQDLFSNRRASARFRQAISITLHIFSYPKVLIPRQSAKRTWKFNSSYSRFSFWETKIKLASAKSFDQNPCFWCWFFGLG